MDGEALVAGAREDWLESVIAAGARNRARSVEVNGLGDPYIPLRKIWLDPNDRKKMMRAAVKVG